MIEFEITFMIVSSGVIILGFIETFRKDVV